MKITDIEVYPISIPYRQLYTLASGSTKTLKRVIVKIVTDEGFYGVGETGTTIPERGGETVEAIYYALKNYFIPKLIGLNPMRIGDAIRVIEDANWGGEGFMCSKCAIDNALYDICGKATGLSAAELLGGQMRDSFHVSRSLGVKSPVEMGQEAEKLKRLGYRMLTVKIGFDPKQDLDRVAAVRNAVGPDFALEVDVNGGYTAEVAVPTLKKMKAYDICAIEQPVPYWDLDGLKRVRLATDIPITADESAWTAQDVIALAKAGAVDTICLKPIKNGGLYLSRRMAEIAHAAGLGVILGSKHPLSPGTAVLRQLAAGIPWISDTLGYGAPAERFDHDIVIDPLTMEADGTVQLPAGSGLGIELDEEAIARFRFDFAG